jgi:hypothetical protein
LSIKEAQMDVNYGNFIELVQRVAFQASHPVLWSQDSPIDYVETEKRLDQFQKDTGVDMKDDSNLFSLGMVSRSDGCVAFLTAQYLKTTYQGKAERPQCVSVVAYILVNKKVLVAITSLTREGIGHKDIRALMQEAEKYQFQLQLLNNS